MRRLLCLLFAGMGPALLLAPSLPAQDKGPGTAWYPLQVGTTWHYKIGDGKFSTRVTKHEKVGETMTARLETTRDGKVIGVEHLGAGPEGVYRHDYEVPQEGGPLHEVLKPPVLILKLPAKKGETWKVDSKADGNVYRGTFKAGEGEVKVPAGTYQAISVSTQDLEASGLKFAITTDFAKGVGMVKQVVQQGDAKVVIELEKFEPGRNAKPPEKASP
jgi:hypothetical protein